MTHLKGDALLPDRRALAVTALGIAVVFAIAGWRYLSRETPRQPAPTIAVTTPAPAVATVASDTSTAVIHLEGTQQILVDDVQILQSRLSAQEADLRKLKSELNALNEKLALLRSFGSTGKEALTPGVEEPEKVRPVVARKKKYRRYARRSKRR